MLPLIQFGGVGVGAAVLLAGVVVVGLTYLRQLSPSGGGAAGLLGAGLLLWGDGIWVGALLAFFTSSSLLGKIASEAKKEAAQRTAKGGRRDAIQVVANGGVVALLLVLQGGLPSPTWTVGMLGALAAATADTWATEVGTYFRTPPRHLLTGRVLPAGLSGGVTWHGTFVGLLGACFLAAFSLLLGVEMQRLPVFLCVVGAGVGGMLFDSLLGATVQVRYQDANGAWTEQAIGPHGPHVQVGGLRGCTNDVVNFLATAFGAIVAVACFRGGIFGS